MSRRRPFSMWLRSMMGDGTFEIAWIWFTFPLVIIRLSMATTDLCSYWQFRSHVAVVQGRVVDSDVDGRMENGRFEQSTRSRMGQLVWLNQYAFRVPGRGMDTFGQSYSLYRGTPRGSAVQVEYRTDNPDASRIVGQTTCPTHFDGWSVIPWLIVWMIPGVWFLRLGVRRSRPLGIVPDRPDATNCPGLRVENGMVRDTVRSVAGALALLILPALVLGGYIYTFAPIAVYYAAPPTPLPAIAAVQASHASGSSSVGSGETSTFFPYVAWAVWAVLVVGLLVWFLSGLVPLWRRMRGLPTRVRATNPSPPASAPVIEPPYLSPDYWKHLPDGSTVTLKDQRTLDVALEQCKSAKPLRYTTRGRSRMGSSDGSTIWMMYGLVGQPPVPKDSARLVTKIVGSEMHMGVIRRVEVTFKPRTPDAIASRGGRWPFEESGDPMAYPAARIPFAQEIVLKDKIARREVRYVMGDGGVAQSLVGVKFGPDAPLTYLPTRLAEYSATDRSVREPELLVIYTYSETVPGDEQLQLMFGRSVSKDEFKVSWK